MIREPFDEGMDVILLKNDFALYPDWKYGPESGWSGQDHYTIKLMRHNFGYWIIVSQHASGENITMNLGSLNNAYDIIALRDALKKLW